MDGHTIKYQATYTHRVSDKGKVKITGYAQSIQVAINEPMGYRLAYTLGTPKGLIQ